VESRPDLRVYRRWVHARPVYFERGPLEAGAGSPANVNFLAQAVDISQGGIGLITQLPLREKDVIRVLIPGPEPSMSQVPVLGQAAGFVATTLRLGLGPAQAKASGYNGLSDASGTFLGER
jgi:hypothetical protein